LLGYEASNVGSTVTLVKIKGGRTSKRIVSVYQNLDTKMIRDAWQISGFDCRIRLRVTLEGTEESNVFDRLLSIGRAIVIIRYAGRKRRTQAQMFDPGGRREGGKKGKSE
jgi:hypothetical protein